MRKKKEYKRLILVSLFCLVMLTGCKKDSQTVVEEPEKQEQTTKQTVPKYSLKEDTGSDAKTSMNGVNYSRLEQLLNELAQETKE